MRVKVVKNKVAPPFRQAEFDIEYGAGISQEGCLLDLGLEHDLVQKSGSFFSYGELRLGQGRNNTKEYLRQNPELADELEEKIDAKLASEAPDAPEPKVVRAVPDAVADRPLKQPKAEEKPRRRSRRRPTQKAEATPRSRRRPRPAQRRLPEPERQRRRGPWRSP